MRRGVYAGSFDPVTNGHLWMLEHGVRLFDEMIVAIGENPDKKYTFSVDERLAMLRETTAHLRNLRVESFQNRFLVDYAREQNADFILRGIREAADYEFERKMRYVNADLAPHVDTVFLMPPREIAEISSTMVKGLVGPDGWEMVVGKYVPEPVFRRLLGWRASGTEI
ncbi:Phosphopantetheine adenylyltransferase [Andreprevotia lacus DSM 23236]|jgi:pantetheine-phosphate adenylyltransferase|uniref:Phosphopantetheine adenylyltransferase n=1 Tax=Andreprevotia lacus DSM 23236 TaxID=1121001 RepID=A0A1W1XXZ6_9NEIS|nr:pantetheine-phosphate adenylyltransferase [Andreprevotia lacus]SMC28803.1 Phosphopantetheine adenylyltransferase [Andreprevotia lacus DSM 23236]